MTFVCYGWVMTFSNRILDFAKNSEFVFDAGQFQKSIPWHQMVVNEFKFGLGWRCDWEKSSFQLMISTDSKLSDLDKAYLEAFCHLSRSLNFTKINLISYRDLENYLRDENHLEAHSRDFEHQILAINWIESLKKELMRPLFKNFFDSISTKPIHSAESLISGIEMINQKMKLQTRIGPHFSNSEIIALIPQAKSPLRYEIQWRFHFDIDPEMAKALCLSLEETLSSDSLMVKVVAES